MNAKLDYLVPVVLRLGLAAVFVWFGVSQLLDPGAWIGFVPAFIIHSPIKPETVINLNGWFEMAGAVLLVIGWWVRPVALILAIHLAFIAIETGGAIGVRDFGLTIACLALALASPDSWTLDSKLRRPKS